MIWFGQKQSLTHALQLLSPHMTSEGEFSLDIAYNVEGRLGSLPLFVRKKPASGGVRLKLWECFEKGGTGITIIPRGEEGAFPGCIKKIKVYANFIHFLKLQVGGEGSAHITIYSGTPPRPTSTPMMSPSKPLRQYSSDSPLSVNLLFGWRACVGSSLCKCHRIESKPG